MLDTQHSRDFRFSYNTDTGILTLRFFDPNEHRNVEIDLYATAVTTVLELLSRNAEAVKAHITPRIEQGV